MSFANFNSLLARSHTALAISGGNSRSCHMFVQSTHNPQRDNISEKAVNIRSRGQNDEGPTVPVPPCWTPSCPAHRAEVRNPVWSSRTTHRRKKNGFKGSGNEGSHVLFQTVLTTLNTEKPNCLDTTP